MKKKYVTCLIFSILFIIGSVLPLHAAEYIFEVPVSIAGFNFASIAGPLAADTSFRVTCTVFDERRRNIGRANQTQRFSDSYNGNVEVRVRLKDPAPTGKARRYAYTCTLAMCATTLGFGPRDNCVDPGSSVPAGSVTEVRGTISP